MDWTSIFLVALGFTVFTLCAVILNPLAARVGWVDHPDSRKQHAGLIPLTGGACILLSTVSVSAFFVESSLSLGLLLGSLLILLVGSVDDLVRLRARYRFAAQIVAALAIALLSGAVIHFLGEAFFPHNIGLGILAIPFTLVSLAGVSNAFNMSDGLDGLCGGHVIVSVAWLTLAAGQLTGIGSPFVPMDEVYAVVLPVLGALFAFMLFNSRYITGGRAVMFLGDGGSMMLGLFVAWLTIHLSQNYGRDGLEPAIAVWFVAVPLIDLVACAIRRVTEGVTPMTADRKHLHHLMLAKGFSVRSTVTAIHLFAAIAGAVGYFSWQQQASPYIMLWLIVAIATVYTLYSIRFWAAADGLAAQGQRIAD